MHSQQCSDLVHVIKMTSFQLIRLYRHTNPSSVLCQESPSLYNRWHLQKHSTRNGWWSRGGRL